MKGSDWEEDSRHSYRIYLVWYFQAERDGSNEFSNYQPGSLNTTDTLIEDLDNYDILFHIGDMPYANGYLSQWDQFTAQVAPISAKKPYMIARYSVYRLIIMPPPCTCLRALPCVLPLPPFTNIRR
jgi:hypothetical protein